MENYYLSASSAFQAKCEF